MIHGKPAKDGPHGDRAEHLETAQPAYRQAQANNGANTSTLSVGRTIEIKVATTPTDAIRHHVES